MQESLRDKNSRMRVSSPPAFLTIDDLAHRWRLHRNSVRNVIDRGLLNPVHFGRAVRIPLSDVERYEQSLQ